MIRVLVVEHAEGLWGAQRYLLRLAPLLAERGIEQVLAAPAGSATAAAWRTSGMDTVELPAPYTRSIRTPDGRLHPGLAAGEVWRMTTLAVATARAARATQADALHLNSHWSHLEGAAAARMARIPAVLHLHEESEQDLLGRMRALAVRGAAASIAVSDAVARTLPPSAYDDVTVIRNGVDADRFRPAPADPAIRAQLAADPSAPVLLTLSRLDPRKGLDKVIRAVATLPPALSHCQLAIAGEPSLVPEHGAELIALGRELLGDRVRFIGPRSDVAEILCAADGLVLASTLEGLPLSVLEAQACARPVVAFPTAGVPEVVTDGETGLLARTDDVEDLGAKLALLLGDAALRERLGEAGRREVVAGHTLAVQADQQADLLQRVVAREAAS
jgi:glycosyltransferase involved in cell wall biosynthesis